VSTPARYRWLATRDEILAAPEVRRVGAASAFVRLVLGDGRPLIGALTIVFDGVAIQFGASDARSAARLTELHREPPVSLASELPPSPAGCGFDVGRADLGLALESARRYRLPVARDRRAGEWVHPVVAVRDAAFFVRTLAQRNLGLGEAFLAGEFEMLRGSVHHFLGFILLNGIDREIRLPAAQHARLLWQYVRSRAARSLNEDIAEHYDLGDNIMVPMLGATGCYSCGYMEREDEDLDAMQLNKMNLIFSKMRLAPGMRVLDTGCGNGGMLVQAALAWGCDAEGFTNSYNMASLARRNAEANGVADRVRIQHADFGVLRRYPDQHFDAIYASGAWEHLSFGDYAVVIRECYRILKPHGRMLIHGIGSHEAKHRRDGYIQKYVFRDSNQIRLHLLLDQARRHDLYVADVENIGRHYYWTLWWWRRNLIEAYETDRSISERDFRVMVYFLECGMAESRFGDGTVYQLLLFKDARDHRATWRVDGRIHEAGHGAVRAMPLLMKPCNANARLNNDSHAPAKAQAAVYRKPGVATRAAQLLRTFRDVTHQ
jgi:cyclopropane-fatty-acyl-phospholipid synthase